MHLITRFLDGGAESTTENEIHALSNMGTDVELHLGVGRSYNRERIKAVSDSGVAIHVFRSIRHYSPFTAVIAVLHVAFHLRKNEIDILHTHSTEAGIIGRFAGHIARTSTIIHEVHGDPITSDRNRLIRVFILNMEKLAAKTTDIMVVKSKNIQVDYLERGIGTRDQYQIIRHGVDVDRFRNAEEAHLTFSGNNNILFVGRLVPGKGIHDLIDAFAELSDEKDVHLYLAGDGNISEYRQYVSEAGARKRVHFLGHRSNIPELMKSTDVFVLPSYREGTPRVITEARAAGLPIVATEIGGIPDQLSDAKYSWLFTPGDVGELSTIIEEALETEMSESTQRQKIDKFSKSKSLSLYKSLYDDLI